MQFIPMLANFVYSVLSGYRDGARNTVENFSFNYNNLYNPNAVVAVSNGMQAVKLCCDKIFRFFTGGAVSRIMAKKAAVAVPGSTVVNVTFR